MFLGAATTAAEPYASTQRIEERGICMLTFDRRVLEEKRKCNTVLCEGKGMFNHYKNGSMPIVNGSFRRNSKRNLQHEKAYNALSV